MNFKHIVFLVVSLAFSQYALAEVSEENTGKPKEFNCKLEVESFKERNPDIDIESPSKDGIIVASRIYLLSPLIAECIFPNVVVTPNPVGEYESIDDELKTVTLTGRITATWGNLVVTEAAIKAPTQDVEIYGANGHYFVTTFEDKALQ